MLAQARGSEQAAVADQGDIFQAEALPNLGRRGAAVGSARQAVDDLPLAGLAVAIVSEGGERAAAALEVGGRHVVQQQGGVAEVAAGEAPLDPIPATRQPVEHGERFVAANRAKLAAEAEDGGDMAVRQGAADAEGLVERLGDAAAAQHGADAVDDLGRELGEVGEGGAADALARVPGLAEEDRGGDLRLGMTSRWMDMRRIPFTRKQESSYNLANPCISPLYSMI